MTKNFPRLLSFLPIAAFVLSSQACSCDPELGGDQCQPGETLRKGVCCAPASAPADACASGFICGDGTDRYDDNAAEACAATCDCVPVPPMPEGYNATQLDMVQNSSGEIWLSGYNPGFMYNASVSFNFQDLVVGQKATSGDTVTWELIDGVPWNATPSEEYSAAGWRNGIDVPGEDVGRFSSIVAIDDNLLVTYEDTTKIALKMAILNGGDWSTHVIDNFSEADGRLAIGAYYTSLILNAAGNPVVLYSVRFKAASLYEQPKSQLRLAYASTQYPTGPADWTVVPLEQTTAEMGCNGARLDCFTGAFCAQVGMETYGRCVVEDDTCTEACSGTCNRGTCYPDPLNRNPQLDMQGLYNNLVLLADGQLAAAWYDHSLSRPLSVTPAYVGNVRFAGGRNVFERTAGPDFSDDILSRYVDFSGTPEILGRRVVTGRNGTNTIYFDGAPLANAANQGPISATFFTSTGGNAYGMRLPADPAQWGTAIPFPIEGFDARPGTLPAGETRFPGDTGTSTTLFVDKAGNWHLAFVDMSNMRLRYNQIPVGAFQGNGTINLAQVVRATVDTGDYIANGPSDRPQAGGDRRRVGDDASIVVTDSGEVRIVYQDVTRIYPLMARCSAACASSSSWTVKELITLPADSDAIPGAGYYVRQILDKDDPEVSWIGWFERNTNVTPHTARSRVIRFPAN